MIWNSIVLMTIIDLMIIGLSIYSIIVFKKYNKLLKKLELERAVLAILSGLLFVSLFHLADLLTMFVLPPLTSQTYAMQVMRDLHLNGSWLVSLAGVSLIVIGLSRLISQLLPKTYRTLIELRASETEIRELNGQLEAKVEARTLALTKSHDKLTREIQERKLIEESLVRSKTRYERLVERSPALIYSYSNRKGGIYYSSQIQVYLGYSPEYLYQHPQLWHDSIHPEDLPRVDRVIQNFVDGGDFEIEYRIRDARGNWHWFYDISVGRRIEGDEIVIEGLAIDITERKQFEAQLQHRAFHDALTQLPNRSFLIQQIDRCLQSIKSDTSYTFAVLFIDLDRFKVINDSLGHRFGDLLLLEIAQRLQQAVRTLGIVARLGGDEFVVLLNNLQSRQQIFEMTEAILEQVQLPLAIRDREFFITASVGIAPSSDRYEHSEEILRDADNAMYKAKKQGRNCFCLFDLTMHEQAVRTLYLETNLRTALENREFQLHYQPILSLETQQLVGFEALVRWYHPQMGTIPPSEFISLAEETSLIIPLERWILLEACRQMQVWQQKYKSANALKMSVNLSGRQFQHNLLQVIDRILQETELPPHCLKLEITERILIEQNKAIGDLFEQWQQRQIQISIDDFGTGYSSLSYLHSFPFDTLKIDKSFVQCHANHGKQMKIVETIVNVAHSLGMDVVAEGIETQQQLQQLQQLGCEMGQGYLFARPQEADVIARTWLQKNSHIQLPSSSVTLVDN